MTDTDQVNLHATTDARVWADEFCKNWPTALSQVEGREGVETEENFYDIMFGWFANAIMAGVDSVKPDTRPSPTREEIENILYDKIHESRGDVYGIEDAIDAISAITPSPVREATDVDRTAWAVDLYWLDELAKDDPASPAVLLAKNYRALLHRDPSPVAGWRGMDSAPNRTDVLLYQDGWAINPVIVGRRDGDVWLSDCFEINEEGQRPTHWMPLPPAPGQQPATEQPDVEWPEDQPDWLWYANGSKTLSFGRWQRDTAQAHYTKTSKIPEQPSVAEAARVLGDDDYAVSFLSYKLMGSHEEVKTALRTLQGDG